MKTASWINVTFADGKICGFEFTSTDVHQDVWSNRVDKQLDDALTTAETLRGKDSVVCLTALAGPCNVIRERYL